MRKVLYLVLIVVAMPCFTLIAQDPAPITIKIKKSDLEGKYAILSEVADKISYIKLETRPEALIGNASGYYVKQMSDRYVIWNSRGSGKIMMFDLEGRFSGHVGSEGKGPGEYYGMYKVHYDKYLDNILVLVNKKVLRYDMSGTFISSVDINTNDSRIERMCIKDEHTWLFTYHKPLKESLFEVGVLATNKEGDIIKQYNLTDENSPGSYGFLTQMNYVYQRENETYYIPHDYHQTYKLNNDDQWVPYINIEAPFKRIPMELYKGINMMKLNDLIQEYSSRLMSATVYGNHMIIWGASPVMFNLLVDIESKERINYSYDKDFKKFGLTNDLDGGMPFFLRGFDQNGISLEMIDAVKLLDFFEMGLLTPDRKDHGPHMNLSEVVESTKPEDNPIIVVVHIKQ